MILSRLFKYFKINLSDKGAVNPSVNINSALLKRMHVGAHVQAPSHPSSPLVQHFVSGSSSSAVDPYAGMMTQLNDLSLQITSSKKRILANQEATRR